ncbi:unnamed protein product [Symbiodinium sp. CCMP2592]|nr:unnamed protein product [Symbiodinium sp. CCMP2592]
MADYRKFLNKIPALSAEAADFGKCTVSRVTPNVLSYSAAMSVAEKGFRWPLALVLLDSMEDPRTSTPRANEVSFNTGISACEKGSNWLLALELLVTMEAARLRSDAVAASAVLAALAAGGMAQRAKRFFRKAQQRQIEPNAVSFGAVISACASWQQVVDTSEVAFIAFFLRSHDMREGQRLARSRGLSESFVEPAPRRRDLSQRCSCSLLPRSLDKVHRALFEQHGCGQKGAPAPMAYIPALVSGAETMPWEVMVVSNRHRAEKPLDAGTCRCRLWQIFAGKTRFGDFGLACEDLGLACEDLGEFGLAREDLGLAREDH